MSRFLMILFAGALFSCSSPEVENSFYYWKANFKLSEGERQLMEKMELRTLYVRYFDVVLKDGKPAPDAALRISRDEIVTVRVVPVVYITNEAMKSVPVDETGQLAKHIAGLATEINRRIGQTPEEWQLDCDWTEGSREQYFELLKDLRKEIAPAKLSATVRLHQVKYKNRTGVPPVDRGMLMHYNMGKLGSPDALNSIYNHDDAANYIRFADRYPLPLDLALPVFSWAIHFRDGRIMALNSRHQRSDYEENPFFRKTSPDLYVADSSAIFRGDYFQKGDLVKIEEVSPVLLQEAAQKIARHLPKYDRKIVFFDLDSTILKSHSYENLCQVPDYFR